MPNIKKIPKNHLINLVLNPDVAVKAVPKMIAPRIMTLRNTIKALNMLPT